MERKELQDKLLECEKLQQQLWAYRPLSAETLKSLREYYRIGLTYTSNAIEGNSLTESETKVVIEDGLTLEGKPLNDIFEAVGHAKAYDYMYAVSHDSPITAEISKRMQQLLHWYNSHEGKMHPVTLAAELHKRFVFIHPFIDGNGRMARLLMNLALMRNDYNIAIIPAICRAEYISALELAHTDDIVFHAFIADRVMMTQMDILRLFRENEPAQEKMPFDQMLLQTITHNPGLNAPKLSERLGRSLRTTQRYIKTLSEKRLIEFRGVAKNGGYYAL